MLVTLDKSVKISSKSEPGAGHIIVNYDWKINDVVYTARDNFIMNTTDPFFQIGSNQISLKVQNDCGKWSDTAIATLEIQNMVQKDVSITVTRPVTDVEVILDFTATVNIRVKDKNNKPVSGATCTVMEDQISNITDNTGLAVLQNVPEGTKTLRVETAVI